VINEDDLNLLQPPLGEIMNNRKNNQGFSVVSFAVLLVVAALIYFFSIDFFNSGLPERQVRNEIKKETTDLFMQEDFNGLDRLSTEYREGGARTSNGLWKLSIFYRGIDGLARAKNNYRPDYDMLLGKVDRWVASSPNSPSAYIAKGIILTHVAWSIRGTDYAEKVKKQNWVPFREKAKETYRYLLSVKQKADVDPSWYEVSVRIMTAFERDINKVMSVANEGLDKFPYYHELYFTTVLYLTPKWHGDDAYIEEFALKSIQRTSQQDRMSMYARIYWYVDYHNYHGKLFSNSDVSWGRMRSGFENIIEDYPVQYNIQKFAYYACLAKDKRAAQRIFGKINEPILMNIWLRPRNYENCRRFVGSDI